MSNRSNKNSSSLNKFLPALGLVLAVALAAVSYVLSAPVTEFLEGNINNFPDPVQQPEIQYVVAVVLFAVLLMFVALLYAAGAPKPEKMISEAELKRERDELAAEKRRRKRQRRRVQREMARRADDDDE